MRNLSEIPFNPSKTKFFYGWVIVFAGTVGIIFSIPGQTMGVSVFTDHLIEALQLDRDTLSIAYMLGTIASSFLLTYAGVLYDKYGARTVAIGAALFLALSLLFASYSPFISKSLSSFLNLRYTLISFTLISIIFFLIRKSGQGILTMVSRNMIMKWFDKLRGRANAVSSAFVSFGFAISPLIFSMLIKDNGWPGAWRIIAASLVLFAVLAYILFRDNPEESGLRPDGKITKAKEETVVQRKQFTLEKAQRTWPFWVFTFALAFYSFFGTGFTFNIESVFETFGYDKLEGIRILIPISVVSIVVSLISNFISDFVRLQYLLFVLIFGQFLATTGIILLAGSIGYYLTVAGFGIMGGIFVVLVSVTWPRFYGRKHLGAISGRSGSILVFSSATGPLFFSKILTVTKGYQMAGIIGLAMVIVLAVTSLKAKNPQ
ncbi:nitrate/nitrite transporter [Saccharicrinis sp. FJH54]|uniref:MFS transporter n=1 Tax=Saccharicrinis sp. FJH54 TaxID=3344665 RepID=UPI0035D4AF1C